MLFSHLYTVVQANGMQNALHSEAERGASPSGTNVYILCFLKHHTGTYSLHVM
jgi:hypothetical protein